MQLLDLKIIIADNIPKRWLPIIFRVYDFMLRALTWLLKGSISEIAISLRISRRSISTNDIAILEKYGPTYLRLWNEAFAEYENVQSIRKLKLAWVHKPACGNFGDWLAPYIVHHTVGAAVNHLDLLSSRREKHIISIGSIISRANRHSTVLGAGINALHDEIDPEARYVMVRGPFTLDAIPSSARSSEVICCDPGFFLGKLYNPRRRQPDVRSRLLIPHLNHEKLFSVVEDKSLTLRSARACSQNDIERLLDDIYNATQVITSAMHVFVACCAFDVPCALVKPNNAIQKVPGDGIKYRDCMSPVVNYDFSPQVINLVPDIRFDDEIDIRCIPIDTEYISKAFDLYKSSLEELL